MIGTHSLLCDLDSSIGDRRFMYNITRITIVCAAVSAALCVPISAGDAQQVDEPVALDIAAQPLAQALTQLAVEADLKLVYYSSVGAGLRAPAVIGRYTAAVALSKLLAGTP